MRVLFSLLESIQKATFRLFPVKLVGNKFRVPGQFESVERKGHFLTLIF